jgi:hypothetical protein
MIVATLIVGCPSSPVVRYRTWLALTGTPNPARDMFTGRDFSTVPGATPESDPE